MILDLMQRVDNVGPKVEHYGCMADKGRWDDVENARKVMKEKGTEKVAR